MSNKAGTIAAMAHMESREPVGHGNTGLTPGLMVVHGNHTEALRDLALSWMARHPLAPLENECILVQSNGVAQWLKLSMASQSEAGIAAALDMRLPSQFLWQAYRAVLGPHEVPEHSPFDKPRLLWRLWRLLPTVVYDTVYAPLQGFLASDDDGRKRHQLAERLADLFDQYQVYRADWLKAWAQGEDVLLDNRGQATPLPADQRWQAALWRGLLADVQADGTPMPTYVRAGRAAVHEAFMQRVRHGSASAPPAGLPRRLVVFGVSSLPQQSLEVLAVLARWCQIVLCVHNPCEHQWSDIVADHELLRPWLRQTAGGRGRRAGMPETLDDSLLHRHAHPLLAAWGKQGRDFIALLDAHEEASAQAYFRERFHALGHKIELFARPDTRTLLGQLQDDIRDLRPLHETQALWPAVRAEQDASIRFHSTHSPLREVEVLHDQLLAAFNEDPSLGPRDVLVMVPDIHTYAPHIQAVFGLLPPQDPRHIPFHIADQGQRRTDPLLHALHLLLHLPDARLTVSEMLDLLDVAALRERFGLTEHDRPLLQRWMEGANIRWGLHTEHRTDWGLPPPTEATARHTWLFGLQRLLLGYAVGSAGGAWADIEPFDEVGGLDAALLGPLSQLVERLSHTWSQWREAATVAEWGQRLRQLLQDFFTPTTPTEEYTLLQLEGNLQDWLDTCLEARVTDPLPLAVVREQWLSGMDQSSLGQRFLGGSVTFASLMPMRALPFRWIGLLGMNDGDYPRSRVPMDFDLMTRNYRPGDRSRRHDDQYMFLEALLSARERLYVSWVGRSVRDNTPRAPSVLVGQLRDHLAQGWRCAHTEADLLASLTTEHPLQPFSPRYFLPSTAPERWFTYAHEWRLHTTPAQPPALPTALSPLVRHEPVLLSELTEFLKDPVRAFMRRRLGVFLEEQQTTHTDHEPFEVDGLTRWAMLAQLAQTLAPLALTEQDMAPALQEQLTRLQRQGDLPAGSFGLLQQQALFTPMLRWMERYRERHAHLTPGPTAHETLDWSVNHQPELRLADTVPAPLLDPDGQRVRVVLEVSDLVRQSRYRADRLIPHWVQHLANHLAGGPVQTHVISPVGEVTLDAMTPDNAAQHLNALLLAWQEGMQRPLPLACKTALEWLRAQGPTNTAHEKAWQAARHTYEGHAHLDGERDRNPYLQRTYPSFAHLTDLAGLAPEHNSDNEFAHWAQELLGPLWRATPQPRASKTAASNSPEAPA